GVEPIRVLCVDDDRAFLEVARELLCMEGDFDVDLAFSVDEAFKKLELGYYDAVVSDYEMASKDGLQFLGELRKQGNAIPFVLFTGKGREEVAIRALNLGANYYLNKQGSPQTVYGELAHAIVSSVKSARAEVALRESETRFRQFFESEPVYSYIISPTGLLMDVNRYALEHLGYSKEELVGKAVFTLYAPSSREKAKALFKQFLETGQIRDQELSVLTKSGEERTVLLSVNSFYDESGKLLHSISVQKDITELKKTQQKLVAAEEEWHATFNTIPDLIVVLDDQYQIVRANRALAEKLGVTPDQCVGLTCYKHIHGTESPPDFCPYIQTLKDGKEHSQEMYLPAAGGHFLVSTSPLKDATGRLSRALHVARDITALKQSEAQLKFQQDMLSLIYDNASEALFLLSVEPDNNYRFITVNNAFLDVTGLQKNHVVGKLVHEVIPEPSLPLVLGKYKQALEEKRAVSWEETTVYPAGKKYGEVTVTPLFDPNSKYTYLLGNVHHVTSLSKPKKA
ncbi:MAG: PAS domain S-box protein, partial [Candidatus Bathyarchaeia archaeon]